MKYIIINLSPRKKGTSAMLIGYFKDRISSNTNSVETCDLYSFLNEMDTILNKIEESDCIVMIGPSYICTYPAETINLLHGMSNKKGVLHGQSLYGFIQGGMPYIHTHENGIKLLENFAMQEDVVFKGGYIMGGGAILNGEPLEKIIGAKKIVPAVNQFIEHIKNDESSSEEIYKNAFGKIPFVIIKMVSVMMNRNIRKDYKKRGIDYKAKSPYYGE